MLLNVYGMKTYELFKSLSQPEIPVAKSYDELKELMKQYQQLKRNIIAECYKVNCRDRVFNESIATYVSELRGLCGHCNYI